MKKNLLFVLNFCLLFVAALLGGCSKSGSNDDTDPVNNAPQIFYRKNGQLWHMNFDGTNDQLIIQASNKGFVKDAIISKDGKTMIVSIDSSTLNHTNNTLNTKYKIYRCNIDGSNMQELVHTTGYDVMYIQSFIDQSSILYSKFNNDQLELWRVNLDGTNNVKLNIDSFEGNARVTSDGKHIIILTDAAISRCNIDGSDITPLGKMKFDGSPITMQALLDDTTILYAKNSIQFDADNPRAEPTISNNLWEINLDGSNNHKVGMSLPTGTFLEYDEKAVLFNNKQSVFFSTTTDMRYRTRGTEAILSTNRNGTSTTLIKQFANPQSVGVLAVTE